MRPRRPVLLATLAGLAAAAALCPVAGAEEIIAPERISTLTWSYSLNTKTLKLKACGRFRPGESDQCAEAELKESLKDGRAIDRTLLLLRQPREKLGIVLDVKGRDRFELLGFTVELLSAPGIGERPARKPNVEFSGESLSQVLWIQKLAVAGIVLRVCGKVANPDRTGCGDHVEDTPSGVRRLRDLLFNAGTQVDQLGFLVGFDGFKFTKLNRIASPTTN